MHEVKIVVGLSYGDEGKGSTVNSLCTDPTNTIVVRFNGGHQAGHTVVQRGQKHVFSNFGSGTMKGIPTYWSEFCTVNPIGVRNEGKALREYALPIKEVEPIVYFDANAMVTTPFDIHQNMVNLRTLKDGTVGVGFGQTIKRNEEGFYRLYMRDLLYPKIRDEKLRLIGERYYDYNYQGQMIPPSQSITSHNETIRVVNEAIEEFKLACDELVRQYPIVNDITNVLRYDADLIFEGAQGIMLDMDYGYFPHVTRSNTTSKNAFSIIKKFNIPCNRVITYYISRAYQTRHGNGYLCNEGQFKNDVEIRINPKETNVDTGAQGIFRRAVLDLDTLRYAINCDEHHNFTTEKVLVMTCCDHVEADRIPITNGGLKFNTVKEIGSLLDVPNVIISKSENGFL
jgi:adenylosuccinate synthase